MEARDGHLRDLRDEANLAKGRETQAHERVSRLRERVETVERYRDFVERTLTLLEKAHPGCSCARWKTDRRHAANCAILQRAEIVSLAEDLGITHWRDEG